MTAAMRNRGDGDVARPTPSGLTDVINTILDKGLAVDAYVRVPLAGIELVTPGARVSAASADSYLRFAEAANRLDIFQEEVGPPSLAGQTRQGGGRVTARAVRGTLTGVQDTLTGVQDPARGALGAVSGILRDVADGQRRGPRRRRREGH